MQETKASLEAAYAPTEPSLRSAKGPQDSTSCDTKSCNEEVQ